MGNNESAVGTFIDLLRNSPDRGDVFNPWWQVDAENDMDENAPGIRRRQLSSYLTERLSGNVILLLGEAMGYQGGHFTGIAMTSERILLGSLKSQGIEAGHVFRSINPGRASRPDLKKGGFSEPTATIVWGALLTHGIDPYRVILWNAYPWHPFQPSRGMLSNRTPDRRELDEGSLILRHLLEIVSVREVFALGNKAFEQLGRLGVAAGKLRHPANGGSVIFRRQLAALARV